MAEELHNSTFLGLELCLFEYSDAECDLVIDAFQKSGEI